MQEFTFISPCGLLTDVFSGQLRKKPVINIAQRMMSDQVTPYFGGISRIDWLVSFVGLVSPADWRDSFSR